LLHKERHKEVAYPMGTNWYRCFTKAPKSNTANSYWPFNNETGFCVTQVSDRCFGQQHTHILSVEGTRVWNELFLLF